MDRWLQTNYWIPFPRPVAREAEQRASLNAE